MTCELFIAPNGKDIPEQAGTKETPLASLSEALERIKLMKKTGAFTTPFTVWLRDGIYPLKKTVVITPEQSIPVTFKAYPGETPVIDGGIHLTGWRKCRLNGKDVWAVDVPDAALEYGNVNQFFVDGVRKTRAAFPKNDFYRIATPKEEDKKLFEGADCFEVKPGDFDPSWSSQNDIEALITHKWIEEVMPFERFDTENSLFISDRKSRFVMDPEDTEYRLENVREALTESGEYYYSKQEKCLYYLPEKNEAPGQFDAVIPGIGSFLRFEGRPEQGELVEWINFEGLTFVYGGAGTPTISADYDFKDKTAPVYRNYAFKDLWNDTGKPLAGSPQGAIHLPGTIFLHGTRHCSISQCTVSHSGWYALEVSSACTGINISRNEFCDIGGGGVKIGGIGIEQMPEKPYLQTSRISVSDNHIHDCGQVNFSGIGVIVTHAFGNLIEHNYIHDLYYSGISCGWSWGYGDSITRENRIGGNHIHDLGKGVISDMGGIYLLGIQPGTRVYSNLCSNIQCRYYGGWGIYTDEGSSHIVIENNICHDCSSEGFHQHYGRENIVRFNIFAFNGNSSIAISAGPGRQTGYAFPGNNYTMNMMFVDNIVLQDGKPFFRQGFSPSLDANLLYSNNNIFWDVSGSSDIFADESEEKKYSWTQWLESGHDSSSSFADPGFINAAERNFDFKKDSPVPDITVERIASVKPGIRTL